MEAKKRRRALTDADRSLIRKRNQMYPPVQQKDLADWFTATTSHPLNQSQISNILSLYYDYLDDTHTKKEKQVLKEKSRSPIGNWPDLEGALFE